MAIPIISQLRRFTWLLNQRNKSVEGITNWERRILIMVESIGRRQCSLASNTINGEQTSSRWCRNMICLGRTFGKNYGDKNKRYFGSLRCTAGTFSIVSCRSSTMRTRMRRNCTNGEGWHRQACSKRMRLTHRFRTQKECKAPYLRRLSPTKRCYGQWKIPDTAYWEVNWFSWNS